MSGKLVFAAWRVSGFYRVEILRAYATFGSPRLSLVIERQGGSPLPIPEPFDSTFAGGAGVDPGNLGWRRIALYHRDDGVRPQLVLDLAGWASNSITITIDPQTGQEQIAFKVNLRILARDWDDNRRPWGALGLSGRWNSAPSGDWPFAADGSAAIERLEWSWMQGIPQPIGTDGRSLADIARNKPIYPCIEGQLVGDTPTAGSGVRRPVIFEALGVTTPNKLGPLGGARRFAYFYEHIDSAEAAAGGSTPRFGIAFAQAAFITGTAKPWPVPGLPLGIESLSGKSTQHWLIQRQAIDDWRRPFVRDGAAHWVVEFDGVAGDRVRRWWNEMGLLPYLGGQRQVLGPRAFSFAPEFRASGWGEYSGQFEQNNEFARYLGDRGWWLSFDVLDKSGKDLTPSGQALRDSIECRLRGLAPSVKHDEPAEQQLRLPALRDHDGRKLVLAAPQVSLDQIGPEITVLEYRPPLLQQATPPAEAMGRRDAGGFVASVQLRNRAAGHGGTYAIGAFDLVAAAFAATGPGADDHSLALTVRVANDAENSEALNGDVVERNDHVAVKRTVLEIEVDAKLPLAAVSPGGQDAPPGTARNRPDEPIDSGHDLPSAPIIIAAAPESSTLLLGVSEASPRLNRHDPANRLVQAGRELTLTLVEQGAAFHVDSVVLDFAPFMFARVAADLNTQDDTNVFAQALLAEGFDLAWQRMAPVDVVMNLPPQGVGEEMEKRQTIGAGRLADFRFAPPARLTLDMAAQAASHAGGEIPWNIRRLLGWPGEEIVGTPINRVEAEMLYGMRLELAVAAPVDPITGVPSRPTGLGPQAAEIGARLGRAVPGPQWPDAAPVETTMLAAWQAATVRTQKRIAVIEVYDPTKPDRFERSDGVSYVLRSKARLHYPIENVQAENQRPSERNAPPLDAQGLKGGVAWPFESANIYEAVWRTTDGDRARGPGEVSGLFLSPLGGWSKQTAFFDNRRTRIQVDVGMGRTHYYSLERIGRIGVLWHHAKHVIIYERTVLPTRQFVSQQQPHAGRAIVRKVREYVEILQRERTYPEGESAPALRGFLRAGRFKSIQIPVDSLWGGDVGDVGWQVPLWRPDADPVVYPKPHILLRLAADPKSGLAEVEAEIDNPQDLVFYTMTTRDTDDRTDLWPALRPLDYADRPAPARPALPSQYAADPDARMPDAAPIEPGFAPFTFALLPTSHDVDVGADRGGTGVGAKIRNVTLMRAAPRPAPPPPARTPALQASLALAALPARFDALFQAARGGAAAVANGAQSATQLKKQLDTDFGEIAKDLVTGLPGVLKGVADINPCDALKKAQAQLIATAASRLTNVVEGAREDMKRSLPNPADPLNLGAIGEELGAARQRLLDRLEPPGLATAQLDQIVAEARQRVGSLAATLGNRLQDLRRTVATIEFTVPEAVRALLADGLGGVVALLGEVERAIPSLFGETLGAMAEDVSDALAEIRAIAEEVRDAALDVAALIGDASADQDALREELDETLAGLQSTLDRAALDVDGQMEELGTLLSEAAGELAQKWLAGVDLVMGPIDGMLHDLATIVQNGRAALVRAIDGAFDTIVRGTPPAGSLIDQATTTLAREGDQLADAFCQFLGSGTLAADIARLAGLADDVLKKIKDAIDSGAAEVDAILQAIESDARRAVGQLADRFGSAVEKLLPSLGEGTLHQVGDQAMRLLRAFGDAPRLPGLDFGRDRLAYYFGEALDRIDITPVTALLDRAGDALKSLGLRLPTVAIGDQLIADALDGLDFSRILPDFAGIKLDRLLPGFALPNIPKDRMRLRHGVDPQTRRGWVEATVDIPSDETATLFAFGPLVVQLVQPHFTADTRLDVDAGGTAQSRTSGRIDGDWQLVVGGFRVVRFVDTPLTFASGEGVRFAIRPENVQMDESLKFLSDLLEQFNASADEVASGLGLTLIREGGLPVGAGASLSLPIPDLQLGAFGISNMNLGAGFEIRALPSFEIALRANLGRNTAPFNLTIFILGGGGWVEARARYLPLDDEIATDLSIGIAASAGLALALGPIRGSIMMYVGIYAELHSQSRGNSSLTVGLMLMIVGQASLAGLVCVAVRLRLDAVYRDDGSLIGTGTLSYSVKICWCFTLRVSQSVTYVLQKGNGGKGSGSADQQRKRRLQDHYS